MVLFISFNVTQPLTILKLPRGINDVIFLSVCYLPNINVCSIGPVGP